MSNTTPNDKPSWMNNYSPFELSTMLEMMHSKKVANDPDNKNLQFILMDVAKQRELMNNVCLNLDKK